MGTPTLRSRTEEAGGLLLSAKCWPAQARLELALEGCLSEWPSPTAEQPLDRCRFWRSASECYELALVKRGVSLFVLRICVRACVPGW